MTAKRAAARPVYHDLLDAHRKKLNRLLDRRGVAAAKKLYDDSQAELARKLAKSVAVKQPFTAHVMRKLSGQVRQGQALIAQRLSGELGDLSREAQVEAVRGVSSWIGRMEQQFSGADITLPIDEAARFAGIIDQRRTSLLAMHRASLARWGARTVSDVETQLALSLMTGETTGDAIDRVMDTTDAQWWQAERIVRTETAWAYNAAHNDTIRDVAHEVDDLYMRWSEHVDDTSRQPLDDRVGADSIAMHGQVARPGQSFTMPRDPKVSTSLWGRSWAFPPNRPNDRAVLSPWRPSWGIPGWRLEGELRVPVR